MKTNNMAIAIIFFIVTMTTHVFTRYQAANPELQKSIVIEVLMKHVANHHERTCFFELNAWKASQKIHEKLNTMSNPQDQMKFVLDHLRRDINIGHIKQLIEHEINQALSKNYLAPLS